MPNTDGNEGTTATAPEAQPAPAAAPAAAEAAGTPAQPDEVTTLRSRNAGLDAKVTSLSTAHKEAIARAEAAEARALALAEGKDNGDAELRAQLAKAQEVIAAAERKAALADIKATYPESYATLGEAVVNMTPEALAAAEARFLGVPAESNRPPTPVGNNAARPVAGGTKPIEDMTLAELKVYAAQEFSGIKWSDIAHSD